MAILLASSYVIGALWVAASIGWWLFNKFDDHRYVSCRTKKFFNVCGTALGTSTVLLLFIWIGACSARNEEEREKRMHEHTAALRAARESFENTYTNVFELLRERNRRELELRLDYDLRVARMIEELNSNSFSVTDSSYTNLPNIAFLRILVLDIRRDINLIRYQVGDEAQYPLEPFSLIEGGAVQYHQDDPLQSD